MKASVTPNKSISKENKVKLPEIKDYKGIRKHPTNEQLDLLDKAMSLAFEMFFKEDPTGTSKILYGGVPVVPVDESGNADIRDMFTKIILTYAAD
jgi:hypothetical protein